MLVIDTSTDRYMCGIFLWGCGDLHAQGELPLLRWPPPTPSTDFPYPRDDIDKAKERQTKDHEFARSKGQPRGGGPSGAGPPPGGQPRHGQSSFFDGVWINLANGEVCASLRQNGLSNHLVQIERVTIIRTMTFRRCEALPYTLGYWGRKDFLKYSTGTALFKDTVV